MLCHGFNSAILHLMCNVINTHIDYPSFVWQHFPNFISQPFFLLLQQFLQEFYANVSIGSIFLPRMQYSLSGTLCKHSHSTPCIRLVCLVPSMYIISIASWIFDLLFQYCYFYINWGCNVGISYNAVSLCIYGMLVPCLFNNWFPIDNMYVCFIDINRSLCLDSWVVGRTCTQTEDYVYVFYLPWLSRKRY